MEYINKKQTETKYTCKSCGENDMTANLVPDRKTGENFIKGWKCNVCGGVNYPIRDRLNRNNRIKISS